MDIRRYGVNRALHIQDATEKACDNKLLSWVPEQRGKEERRGRRGVVTGEMGSRWWLGGCGAAEERGTERDVRERDVREKRGVRDKYKS
ncbi:hypothetical protein RND71_032742 [Anisodus tanguticus]|uniref:Uncharacterized protein n=1 Tax=Anisodus tanguticus TaxID=243964 RepID=A0AAE1UVJ1_9SOLA|nr:hypothetical protein RND71_032742 [Anisodus tanguticus]